MKIWLAFLLAWVILVPTTFGKKTQSTRVDVFSVEKELAGFRVPEGFVVELVASEADGIVNPIDLTFDDAGRLWTQTANMYPLDPVADASWQQTLAFMDDPESQRNHPAFKRVLDLYEGKTKGTDKILIIPDPHAKKPRAPIVWADGLAIPQSILPYKNGAFVAQGSELFFLADTNNDGKSDTRTPVFKGFGFIDTHTMVHLLTRAPGGWVHFSQGALNKGKVTAVNSDATIDLDYCKNGRYSMDGKQIELIGNGLNNIWGYQMRGNGQWFGCEANDQARSIVPMEPQTGYRGIGNEQLRPYQPWFQIQYPFRVGGTGISGLAFADDTAGSFGKAWQDVALLANSITNTINAVRVVRNADGSVTAEHLPDFLTSEDDWFRPVNMVFGPDGSLYVADWYNKIISHNEVARSHPDRDKKHGRIWRIRKVDNAPRKIVDFYKVKDNDLVDYLKSPSIKQKLSAWHQITDRGAKVSDALIKLLQDNSQDEITHIHALWSLEGIGHFDAPIMQSLLNAPNDNLRREAVRSLASFSLSTKQVATLLRPLINDNNAMVRSQLLRTLGEIKQADQDIIDLLVFFCRDELPGNALGGPYERKFERFLARMALEQYRIALTRYLGTQQAQAHPATNLLWASQALAAKEKAAAFLTIWPSINQATIDSATFIIVAQLANTQNAQITAAIKPMFATQANAHHLVNLANTYRTQIYAPAMATLLATPIDYLLRSGQQIDLALDAANKFNVKHMGQHAAKIIQDPKTAPATLQRAMDLLVKEGAQHIALFKEIIHDNAKPFELKQPVLISMIKIDPAQSQALITTALKGITPALRAGFIDKLSSLPAGANVLLDMIDAKHIGQNEVSLSQANRIDKLRNGKPRSKALVATIKVETDQKEKQFNTTLKKFIAIAQKNEGDPALGKPLFTAMCLSCHGVAGEGAGFAPDLDGSAHRDNEGLLTAILNPDAAAESSYYVYQVTKKDGTILEGYKEKQDDQGTTLRFMGGASLFIPAADIKTQQFLGGKSMMPGGLIDHLPEATVANLLAYIRTLK